MTLPDWEVGMTLQDWEVEITLPDGEVPDRITFSDGGEWEWHYQIGK